MKREWLEYFRERVSRSAIRQESGEMVIRGKWCEITQVGDRLDVFICNPDDMQAGLGQRKVTNIVRALEKTAQEGVFTVLNGEAYTQGLSVEIVCQHLSLLGIRKKRRVSEKQKAVLSERLARMRRGGA